MKILGLNGRSYNWNIKHRPKRNASKLHTQVRKLLHELFPLDIINEEVVLPGSKTKGQPLTADFYIHTRRLMIEVHGQQHYEYSPYFHKDRIDFAQGQHRDRLKRSWCENNNIRLVELPYNETKELWTQRILNE